MKLLVIAWTVILYAFPSFAQQVAADNFTRANSGTLGSNWTATLNGFSISGNAALAGSNETSLEYWSANSFLSGQYSTTAHPATLVLVANGRVYIGTMDSQVLAFGLLTNPAQISGATLINATYQ